MPLDLRLDYDSGVPVYRQIFDAVLAALAAGALGSDEQLPTIHDLARRLAINPNTVARAYRDLERAGHIVAKRGKGTFAQPAEPSERDTEAVLRGIFDRAVADAARYRIGPREVIDFFRKAQP